MRRPASWSRRVGASGVTSGVLAMLGCLASGASAQPYDRLGFPAPRGDAAAGRAAFVELRCTACHRVTGVDGLPAPVATTVAPDLTPALVDQTRSRIAESIVAPDHRISRALAASERRRLQHIGTPMADYTDVMTVRQLVDLIAFLQDIDRDALGPGPSGPRPGR